MPGRRIAIAAGGTAGHIYPALAFATEIRNRFPDTEVLFVATGLGLERDIVPRAGYRLELVSGSPFQRTSLAGKARAITGAAAGILDARNLLRRERIDAVIGFGGYASVGTVLAAKTLGIWSAIHEANAEIGQANRLLRHFVNRIYLTFDSAATRLDPSSFRIVGTPVRAEIARRPVERHAPDLASRPLHVLVLTGSERSEMLAGALPGLFARLRELGIPVQVRHQAPSPCGERVRAGYAAAGVDAQVVDYLKDIAAEYSWADFAITRAGASTLAELSLSGLPALLVPLPEAAEDHQTRNARWFASHGAGLWASEAGWDGEALAASIAALVGDPRRWSEASGKSRTLVGVDATSAMAQDVAACLARRNGNPKR